MMVVDGAPPTPHPSTRSPTHTPNAHQCAAVRANKFTAELALRNTTEQEVVFKIRTHAAERYFVKPHNGLLHPGGTTTVYCALVGWLGARRAELHTHANG